MTDSTHNQLVTDLGRDLISQIAPQEIPIFRANSEAYFKDPQKTLSARVGKDEALGFGIGEAAAFLTPIALAVITEVVKFLAEEVKKSLATETSSVINEMVKKLFKRFHPAEKKEASQALTKQQIEQIRQLSFAKARQLNLTEGQANLLADTLVASLVTAST